MDGLAVNGTMQVGSSHSVSTGLTLGAHKGVGTQRARTVEQPSQSATALHHRCAAGARTAHPRGAFGGRQLFNRI